jgi:acyl phosphate:glycerol-3-phosphate acyltransferase
VSERRDGFFEPLTRKEWQAEARRKAIHLSFLVLPLVLLLEPLPWPRSRGEFRILFLVLTATAIALDVLRIHERRVRTIFRRFFGELIRQHEALSLLGSTYLLLAALIAIEVFPQPIAAVALGFTVLGDAASALVGRAWGRHKLFGKSWEGTLGCLVTCLAWAACVTHAAGLPLQITVAGAFVATLVEVLPIPLDDNLGITLAAGYTMKLMAG